MRISVKGAGQDSLVALHWRCEISEPITCSELSKVRFDTGTHILSKCSKLCVLAIPRWEKLVIVLCGCSQKCHHCWNRCEHSHRKLVDQVDQFCFLCFPAKSFLTGKFLILSKHYPFNLYPWIHNRRCILFSRTGHKWSNACSFSKPSERHKLYFCITDDRKITPTVICRCKRRKKYKRKNKNQGPVREQGPASARFKCIFRVWKGTGEWKEKGWVRRRSSFISTMRNLKPFQENRRAGKQTEKKKHSVEGCMLINELLALGVCCWPKRWAQEHSTAEPLCTQQLNQIHCRFEFLSSY